MQAIIYFLKEKKKIGKMRYIFRCMYKQLFFFKRTKMHLSIYFFLKKKKKFPLFLFSFFEKRKKKISLIHLSLFLNGAFSCLRVFLFFKKKKIYLLYLHVYYLFYHFSYCTPSTICIIYITKKKEKKKN